jgi:hypothetical protein
MNESKGVGINMERATRLVTWRAACAERPQPGRGSVTARCERQPHAGERRWKGVFWQKPDHGQSNSGYFTCDD